MLGRNWRDLPRLIRFMMTQFMDGATLGCAFGLVLIRTDSIGLGQVLESYGSAGPTALFLGQGALTFGTLYMAFAVMTLGDEER
ncbi:MAG: hypothetical protein P1U72_20435 [Paracoccaceae bacterium]|nr:hypothetical protein [Paracoccaceae bacterium]